MLRLAALVAPLAVVLHAVPIPNRIIGNAEVECGEDRIDVSWTTEEPFNGRVYAVGHVNEEECVETTQRGRRSTSISLPKNACGITSERSENPPGLYVNFRVMVSFHPDFITKVDRGFEISCFYMETEKTVTFPLTVSMKDLIPNTVFAEMPRCRYEVFEADTNDPASIVSVGDALLHKWTCDSSTPGLWCMTVHSCFVRDDSGTEAMILDDEGCEIDKFLLQNLDYNDPPMHLMVSKEAHAFKFADKVVVNFQCAVRLDIKRDDTCPRPQCDRVGLGPLRSRFTQRLKRDAEAEHPGGVVASINSFDPLQQEEPAVNEVTVVARQIDVIDPVADFGLDRSDASFRAALNRAAHHATVDCVDARLLVAPACLLVFLLALLTVAVCLLYRHNNQLRRRCRS